MVCEMRLPIMN